MVVHQRDAASRRHPAQIAGREGPKQRLHGNESGRGKAQGD
jgi:hypothetical protein